MKAREGISLVEVYKRVDICLSIGLRSCLYIQSRLFN